MPSHSRQHSRADVIACARRWIGTPYHHQASTQGVGADCLGLVRGVWRELYGSDAETPPPYTRDWAEAMGRETLIEAAARHMTARGLAAAQPGDVVVFRYRPGVPAKHLAILSAPGSMIHTVEGAAVAEVGVTAWWRRRMVAVFAFPGTRV